MEQLRAMEDGGLDDRGAHLELYLLPYHFDEILEKIAAVETAFPAPYPAWLRRRILDLRRAA
jgi:hypothetical protein